MYQKLSNKTQFHSASLVMSEKVCKILLVLSLMLGVPQAWGKFVMLIYLCHFT